MQGASVTLGLSCKFIIILQVQWRTYCPPRTIQNSGRPDSFDKPRKMNLKQVVPGVLIPSFDDVSDLSLLVDPPRGSFYH